MRSYASKLVRHHLRYRVIQIIRVNLAYHSQVREERVLEHLSEDKEKQTTIKSQYITVEVNQTSIQTKQPHQNDAQCKIWHQLSEMQQTHLLHSNTSTRWPCHISHRIVNQIARLPTHLIAQTSAPPVVRSLSHCLPAKFAAMGLSLVASLPRRLIIE